MAAFPAATAALRQEAQDVQADDYDDDDHDEVEDGGDVEPAQLDDRVCNKVGVTPWTPIAGA